MKTYSYSKSFNDSNPKTYDNRFKEIAADFKEGKTVIVATTSIEDFVANFEAKSSLKVNWKHSELTNQFNVSLDNNSKSQSNDRVEKNIETLKEKTEENANESNNKATTKREKSTRKSSKKAK